MVPSSAKNYNFVISKLFVVSCSKAHKHNCYACKHNVNWTIKGLHVLLATLAFTNIFIKLLNSYVEVYPIDTNEKQTKLLRLFGVFSFGMLFFPSVFQANPYRHSFPFFFYLQKSYIYEQSTRANLMRLRKIIRQTLGRDLARQIALWLATPHVPDTCLENIAFMMARRWLLSYGLEDSRKRHEERARRDYLYWETDTHVPKGKGSFAFVGSVFCERKKCLGNRIHWQICKVSKCKK